MGDMSGSKETSSSQSETTNTTNIDRRQVVAEGGMGLSADNSTLNVRMESLDGGIVQKALDTVAQSDAVAGQGFNQLLTLADKVITGAGGIIAATQQTTDKQMDIIASTANDQKGQVDQKTIMVALGFAGAAAVVYAMNKGK